jgi:hypothetical protein
VIDAKSEYRDRLRAVFLFGRLFIGAYKGKLAALDRERDADPDHDESHRRAQASRRDTIDAGANNCWCFVHSATFLETITFISRHVPAGPYAPVEAGWASPGIR